MFYMVVIDQIKCANPRGSLGGGWSGLELTDTLGTHQLTHRGDMEFSIKILPFSKISFPLNRLITKIFLPHINFIAAQPSPAHENQPVCPLEVLTKWM